MPTPSRSFWVYNRTGKGLRCQSVRLENGNQKGYRVNVDGSYLGTEAGFQTQNVEIRKGDSIRVYVELTSAMQNSKEPQLVSVEDHFKYRQAVMEAYPCGHYPVFEGYDHMQYQIRDPKGFAEMLAHIAERDCMPELPFIRK